MSSSASRIGLEIASTYLRSFPWDWGRWRLISPTLNRAAQTWVQPELRTVKTRYAFRIRVDLSDWLGRHVFVTGDYEPATSALIASLLRPGDRFIDIGANIGFFTLLASMKVGPNGKIFAFEPTPTTRNALVANLQENLVHNVAVRPEAASDCTGRATFQVGPPNHRGISSLRKIEGASEQIEVMTARLDDLIEDLGGIHLMKVDVEGAELAVLRGATQLLEQSRPDLIIEVTDRYLKCLGDSESALFAFLKALDYQGYFIGQSGLVSIDLDSPTGTDQYNAFFSTKHIDELSSATC